jgi:hypothetical protein
MYLKVPQYKKLWFGQGDVLDAVLVFVVITSM